MTDRQAPNMLCPVCNVSLVMSERQNVEIDYCPQCRGVWLDRGELDKIIERVAAEEAPRAAPPPPPSPQQQQPYPSQGGYRPDYGHGHSGYKKRKKSFLEDLFD